MRGISKLAGALLLLAGAAIADEELPTALARAAPEVDARLIAQAVDAMACAQRDAATPARRLALIDYSRPSTEQRLWVFDLDRRALLYAERVAHGQGSGDNLPTRFSNLPGSHQSSLGLFRTGDTYVGRNGYSLRLVGLEPGVNDRALERAIVMHGAPYVSDAAIGQLGRLGRSWGCPAVRSEVARELIDQLKDGQYLYAWYPRQDPSPGPPRTDCEAAARNVVAAAAPQGPSRTTGAAAAGN